MSPDPRSCQTAHLFPWWRASVVQFRSIGDVERCPHCSVATPLFAIHWKDQTPSTAGNRQIWAFGSCVRCGKGICIGSYDNYDVNYDDPAEVFPRPKRAHDDIPQTARTFLQQAYDTLHSPDAASVMAGSAVDAMLKHLGYIEGSVYNRIDAALSANIITKGMADWAHAVRLGANRPRHADIEAPHTSASEAQNSVDFAEALANFLFVLSAKVDRGIVAATA